MNQPIWYAITSAVLAAGIYGIGTLIKSWIEGAVRSTFELERQRVDDELERNRNLLSALQSTMGAAGLASFQRRLLAVEHLWTSVIEMRQALPAAVAIAEVCSDEELLEYERYPTVADAINRMTTNDAVAAATSGKAGQNDRVFVDDVLWSLFSAYQLVVGRAAFRLDLIRSKRDRETFRSDKAIRHVITLVIAPERVPEFSGNRWSLMKLLAEIENRFVTEAQRFISGETAADALRKNAAELITLAREARDVDRRSP